MALTWLQTNNIPTNDPTNIKIFLKISKNENKLFFSEIFGLAFFFSFFAIFKIQYRNGRTWQMDGRRWRTPTSTLFLFTKKEKLLFFLFYQIIRFKLIRFKLTQNNLVFPLLVLMIVLRLNF